MTEEQIREAIDEFVVGEKVHYSPKYGKKENGMIKSITPHGIFVVYHCNGEWSRYQEYTAANTDIEGLRHGWINLK